MVTTTATPPAGPPYSILIADDDRTGRDTLAGLLAERGFVTLQAGSGEDEGGGEVDWGGRAVAGYGGGDDGGEETGEAVEEAGDTRTDAAGGGGEDLGREGVQDAVHDVLAEGLDAGEE